jgi:hypothetical protein
MELNRGHPTRQLKGNPGSQGLRSIRSISIDFNLAARSFNPLMFGASLAVEPADFHSRLRLLRPFLIAQFEAEFLAANNTVQSFWAALRGTLMVKLVDSHRRGGALHSRFHDLLARAFGYRRPLLRCIGGRDGRGCFSRLLATCPGKSRGRDRIDRGGTYDRLGWLRGGHAERGGALDRLAGRRRG